MILLVQLKYTAYPIVIVVYWYYANITLFTVEYSKLFTWGKMIQQGTAEWNNIFWGWIIWNIFNSKKCDTCFIILKIVYAVGHIFIASNAVDVVTVM